MGNYKLEQVYSNSHKLYKMTRRAVFASFTDRFSNKLKRKSQHKSLSLKY